MADWDVSTYQRYKAQRDRPALDLLLQIPRDLDPAEIWDLGCGAGEQAAVLAARHPGAAVHGLDSSEAMLDIARKRSATVDWRLGDIAAHSAPSRAARILAGFGCTILAVDPAPDAACIAAGVRYVEFHELFDTQRGPQVLVVTFIAMLELAKERLLEITQAEAFAPIYVRLAYTPS